ncbi:MAG: hypothetical protein WC314_07745 [Vulcanimicrobiota bacterium]
MSIQNTNSILERLGGSVDLLAQIADLFLRSWKQDYDRLTEALKNHDTEPLSRAVRQLKDSLGYFADKKTLALFKEMEKNINEGTLDEALRFAASLEGQLQLLAEKLQELRKHCSR